MVNSCNEKETASEIVQKTFIEQKYYDIEFNLKIDEDVRFNTSDESLAGFQKREIKP